MRTAIGVLLIAAGLGVVAWAYGSLPSAQACQVINNIQAQLGGPPTCSSSPSAGRLVIAGLLILAGLVTLLWPRARQRPGG